MLQFIICNLNYNSFQIFIQKVFSAINLFINFTLYKIIFKPTNAYIRYILGLCLNNHFMSFVFNLVNTNL